MAYQPLPHIPCSIFPSTVTTSVMSPFSQPTMFSSSKAVSRKAPGIPGIEDDPVKTKTDKVKIGLIKAVIFMVVIVFTVTIIIYVSRRHTRINAGEINENRMEMAEIGYSHVRLLTQRRLLTRLIMSGRAVLSLSILFNLIQSL